MGLVWLVWVRLGLSWFPPTHTAKLMTVTNIHQGELPLIARATSNPEPGHKVWYPSVPIHPSY